jgi:CRISPR-associated exonuclease Cas4
MTSASHLTYYLLCHRKLWLHHRGMRMEDNSAAVAEGKLIGENSYTRRATRWQELNLGHLKIDHYDPRANVVREVKKSNKLEHVHIAQVKYYLLALEQKGLAKATGLIEYPQQRKTTTVTLSAEDRTTIAGWEAEIERIIALPDCPPLVKKGICRNCAFYDFCFV